MSDEVYINTVTEDRLSRILVHRILLTSTVKYKVNYDLPHAGRRRSAQGNGYIRKNIMAFNEASRFKPCIVVLDLDKRECAPAYRRDLLPDGNYHNMILRIAVREIESWVMADRDSFSSWLGISQDNLPLNVDDIDNPKEELFKLVRRSRKRKIKEGILPPDELTRTGPQYNLMLCSFVQENWERHRAARYSDSLTRALHRIDSFKPL